VIYLNNAATSYPKPGVVLESAALAAAAIPGEPRRSSASTRAGESQDGSPDDCRAVIADFFGAAGPDEVLLTQGATVSLNMVLSGLGYKERRRVVTSAAEHNAVLRPLYALERAGDIDLTIVPCDAHGFIAPETLAASVDASVRAIVIQEASNVTGAVQDLAAASDIARHNGCVLVVDGAQGSGMTGTDLRQLAVDAYVFAGHKGLFGLEGSGGFILRRGLELEPLIRGGTGLDSANREQPQCRPDLYEAGTQNRTGTAALAAGVRYVAGLGRSAVRERLEWFLEYTSESLSKLPHIRTVWKHGCHGESSGLRLPVFSFAFDGSTPTETAYCLEQSFGIRVRHGLHCAPLIHQYIGFAPEGTVRASPSILTPHDHWALLFEALAAMEPAG